MKKLLCKIFGHRWRCLMRHVNVHQAGWGGSSMTGWLCDRCGKTDNQQWDW